MDDVAGFAAGIASAGELGTKRADFELRKLTARDEQISTQTTNVVGRLHRRIITSGINWRPEVVPQRMHARVYREREREGEC